MSIYQKRSRGQVMSLLCSDDNPDYDFEIIVGKSVAASGAMYAGLAKDYGVLVGDVYFPGYIDLVEYCYVGKNVSDGFSNMTFRSDHEHRWEGADAVTITYMFDDGTSVTTPRLMWGTAAYTHISKGFDVYAHLYDAVVAHEGERVKIKVNAIYTRLARTAKITVADPEAYLSK